MVLFFSFSLVIAFPREMQLDGWHHQFDVLPVAVPRSRELWRPGRIAGLRPGGYRVKTAKDRKFICPDTLNFNAVIKPHFIRLGNARRVRTFAFRGYGRQARIRRGGIRVLQKTPKKTIDRKTVGRERS